MTHKLVLVSASVFAMSGLVPVAHATSLDDVCNLLDPIENDTKVDQGGAFSGNCTITVDNAVLEIDGVTIDINGALKFVDVPEDEGAAALVIKNAQITITTADRLEVEGAWNGGVTLENNHVNTGEDLRVKPTGGGDLMFTNNGGAVAGDIRLGDAGLQGDIVARNNAMNVAGDFRAETTDGDITVRNNGIENSVSNVQIVSASGDIGVKNNEFSNTATAQGITVTSEDGDVRVRLNTFGVNVGAVSIESTTGPCESNRNGPVLVDQEACQS